jgi:hypothetical protein
MKFSAEDQEQWKRTYAKKKAALPFPRQPGYPYRPVAFRARLSTGLAFTGVKPIIKIINLLSRKIFKFGLFMASCKQKR